MDVPHKAGGHFYELDSLRGVAAATVVLWHFSLAFPREWLSHATTLFPLRAAFSGHAAVILFFVLSGFVLTLPMLRGRQPSYSIFLQKRMLRIYLPYLGALVLALAGDALLHGATRTAADGGAAWTHVWANQTWNAPITAKLMLQQIVFLGNYDWAQVNTVFWSLIYELRISLVFPFLAMAVLRWRQRWVLAGMAACSLAAYPLKLVAAHYGYQDSQGLFASQTFITIHYAVIFMLGAMLAVNLSRVTGWFERMSRLTALLVGFAALLLFDGQLLAKAVMHMPVLSAYASRFLFGEQVQDWSSALAALLLIPIAICMKPVREVLHSAPVHQLGKISYSLYLLHGTVLFAMMHWFGLSAPIGLLFGVYVLLTLGLSQVFYWCIEMPSIRASKLVGKRYRVVVVGREAVGAVSGAGGAPEDVGYLQDGFDRGIGHDAVAKVEDVAGAAGV